MANDEQPAGNGWLRAALFSRPSAVVLLILLAAFALRVWHLTGLPPGLTHDEANHGREAIGILNGVYLYFFPLNYGSEPLYSYTVALFMALLGRGVLALRLVNVVFGTAAIALTYVWASPRLGRPVALLGAALMAVSFWPLASSREALRVGMLPFFMALAVYAFWRMTHNELRMTNENTSAVREPGFLRAGRQSAPASTRLTRHSSFVILFGLAVALTLHIYLAARVSWLLFPAFLAYLALIDRAAFRRLWPSALAGLSLAAALVAPMFLYLRAHPEMQTRLDMLDRPLQDIAAGRFGPIWLNVRDALLAFVWPGFGDQFLAYNIPGRPVLDAVSAVFFVAGVLVCLGRWRRPVYAFLLMWFLTGIIPSLVTGPTANTTRNMAALPAVYLIVAVGAVAVVGWLMSRVTNGKRSSFVTGRSSLITLLVLWVAFVSARDYFVRWGDSAAVRGAYQHTLVESIRHLQANYPAADPILFSTIYPGPAHDSSIARVVAAASPPIGETARWVDARYALILPPAATLAVIPYSTSPHPVFIPLLGALETVDLRPDDLDPRFTVYQIDPGQSRALLRSLPAGPAVNFNGAIELLGARWLQNSVRPGATAELLTLWRVLDPARAGPVVPPSFTTDAVLFTHVVDGAGGLLTQRDALDAPSWAWQSGDLIAQVHPLTVPTSAAPGAYAAVVGFYDRQSGARLPVVGGGDTAAAPPLLISP
ncbi:MAG: glycosyltransferase family 39 protein [Candidatus Promineofilum sp.]|nr:glycosyltransferase family 39 protein [Promineifilum sp.]